MNLIRIYGLFLRHFYLITRSFPRILDLIYWPSIQITLWGFISNFFAAHSSYYSGAVGVILSCAILYDFLFRTSIGFNMLFLEEIWSRNFTNLFIAPMKISEIIISSFYCFNKSINWFNPSYTINFSIVWYIFAKTWSSFGISFLESIFIWNNTWSICFSRIIKIWTIF